MRKTPCPRLNLVPALLLLGLIHPQWAVATSLTVTSCAYTTPGGAPGELRRLVMDAASGDTIIVPACVITLTGAAGEDANQAGDLDLSRDLTIVGAGPGQTVIDGGSVDRVFHIHAAATVTISGLTIRNGQFSAAGGGILNEGHLVLNDVVVSGNFGGDGGGLANSGFLTLTRVTVRENYSATGGGMVNGGIAHLTASTVSGNVAESSFAEAGGIRNSGILTLENSTVSGNQVFSRLSRIGGGIASISGLVTLGSSTIANNAAAALPGGGGQLAGDVFFLSRTIVAHPAGGTTPDCALFHTTVSRGTNLISDTSCAVVGLPSDLQGIDPGLGPLADNGGPTQTHALLPGSPAIDVGPIEQPQCLPTDQRGVLREVVWGLCDIGAFEVPFAGGLFVAAGDLDGTGKSAIITGPGVGGLFDVRTFDPSGARRPEGLPVLSPFGPAGLHGASVVACDLDGDGRAELIGAFGPGSPPTVIAGSPTFGLSFSAYDPRFGGGVFVACADVDGDGVPEIITGAGAGGGPHVRVFKADSVLGPPLTEFFAFAPGFLGGVRVAAGNVDGSDRASIIVGAGPGGGPHVRVLKYVGGAVPLQELASFFAYVPGFAGGVFVAGGDVDGDGRAEIITGAGEGGGPHVRVFIGTGADAGVGFFAYVPGFPGGVRVAVGDLTGDGVAEILTAAGPGGGPHVRAFSGAGAALPVSFFAY